MAELEPTKVEVTTSEQSPILPVHVVPDRPRRVYQGMWGPVEIGVVAAGAMAFLASLMVYLFFVVPSNRELALNRSKADSLEAEVVSARTKYGEITSSQDQVTKILASVDDFETRFLPAVSNGQQSLYQRINGLIGQYGLVNTNGPDYEPLELSDKESSSDDNKGREKFRSLYPGVYVTMTVEGPYQNLRRFIREVETGNEFVLISAVELAPSDSQGAKQPAKLSVPVVQQGNRPGNPLQPGAPVVVQPAPQFQTQGARQTGKMHGEVVALHIELAAYFRRPNFAPTVQ